MNEDLAREKKEALLRNLGSMGSLLVEFSGGVDSTFLLAAALEAFGEKVAAATARSIIHPDRETDAAVRFARERGIRHVVFPTREMEIPAFLQNGPDRCYVCKRHLFECLSGIAKDTGARHVVHGANLDDRADFRPGMRAAKEAGVAAPLMKAGLVKEEIRFLSKEMGLTGWDLPAQSCLATRIPYGDRITEKKIRMIAAAETVLLEHGFLNVRARHHGAVVRIEVEPARLKDLLADGVRDAVAGALRKIGFRHVALDLEGYVCGSLNRSL